MFSSFGGGYDIVFPVNFILLKKINLLQIFFLHEYTDFSKTLNDAFFEFCFSKLALLAAFSFLVLLPSRYHSATFS